MHRSVRVTVSLPEGVPPGASAPRIVVTGVESTGKTTLARQLATALHTDWVPEFSRSYAEHVGRALTADDVEPIARGQIAREDAAIALTPAQRPLVFDTDLVSTTVYAEHYYGSTPPWILAVARGRLADLYLLCSVDLPWEADGVRDQPHGRAALYQRFADRLREFGATTVTVGGHGDARLAAARAAVRGWRAARV